MANGQSFQKLNKYLVKVDFSPTASEIGWPS